MPETTVLRLLFGGIGIGHTDIGSNEDIGSARIAAIIVQAKRGARENLAEADFGGVGGQFQCRDPVGGGATSCSSKPEQGYVILCRSERARL